jgi:phosphate transport system substrate-binding protein
MPKLGTSIRIISAAAAAALLAVVVAGAANAKGARQAATISGAGSTFVAPLVSQWISPIGAAYGIELQYSAIGSGGGIAAITSRTVDFGASDAPLTSDQFNACNGCEQIPWALGGTSIMYNLPGVKNLLHIDGPTLAKIFMGQITKWNDPAIQSLNKGVSLPDTAITIAHRSDNSGTTYNLTDYLSTVSPAWASQLGRGVAVNWPVGVGGKGSSGVAGVVSSTPGAIGYADVAYALTSHLKYFAVKNRSGKYTTPGARGQLAVDREPAEEVRQRVPDLDVHVRDRSAAIGSRDRPEALPVLGRHEGPDRAVHGEAPLRAVAEVGARRRGEGDREDPQLGLRVLCGHLCNTDPPPLHGAAGPLRRHASADCRGGSGACDGRPRRPHRLEARRRVAPVPVEVRARLPHADRVEPRRRS